jgi:hypothetical protein
MTLELVLRLSPDRESRGAEKVVRRKGWILSPGSIPLSRFASLEARPQIDPVESTDNHLTNTITLLGVSGA